MLRSREWLGTAGDVGTRAGAGSMAHRKGLVTARMGTFIALGLLVALLMAGRVVLLNQVTNMRARNAQLLDRKSFLETRHAALQASWNQATRPQVICERARRELGLVQPRVPDPVLVRLPAEQKESRWRLPGWLPALAGGEPARAQGVAAQPPRPSMITLRPRAKDTDRPEISARRAGKARP